MIEGPSGVGIKSFKDSAFINGRLVNAELKVNNHDAEFVRGTLPAGEIFNLYAIIGYGSGDAEITPTSGFPPRIRKLARPMAAAPSLYSGNPKRTIIKASSDRGIK